MIDFNDGDYVEIISRDEAVNVDGVTCVEGRYKYTSPRGGWIGFDSISGIFGKKFYAKRYPYSKESNYYIYIYKNKTFSGKWDICPKAFIKGYGLEIDNSNVIDFLGGIS